MNQPANEGPVRVRLYGLVSMTRRRYLMQMTVALVLAGGLLALWWAQWPMLKKDLQRNPSPVLDRAIAFWDAAPWVIGAVIGLQAVEAFFVLRAFRRKEAERAAQAAAPPAG
jgi:hypothetical protein